MGLAVGNAKRVTRVRRVRRPILVAIILATMVPATQCMREDEVECEEAVQSLVDCCPGFDHRSVRCEYQDTCGITYPDFTPGESQCIFEKSCSQIVQAKICDRVHTRAIRAHGPDYTEAHDAGISATVCP